MESQRIRQRIAGVVVELAGLLAAACGPILALIGACERGGAGAFLITAGVAAAGLGAGIAEHGRAARRGRA